MEENRIPKLTLEPDIAAPAPAAEPVPQASPAPEQTLTPEELKVVEDFAKQIDITNTNQVIQYGAAAQKSIAEFSEAALDNVRTKDMGAVGDMITDLVTELQGFSVEDKKGIAGFFAKQRSKASALKTRYEKAEVSVERIAQNLEDHQVTLLKDIAMLDKMYEKNLDYFRELNMYILAGQKKLEQARTVDLPRMMDTARQTGSAEDAQAANDMSNMINRFEKRLHDLELTRTICMQMAPQIRMVQNNDTQMVEKIQSTVSNTIPLWKSQMVIALGLAHSQEALKSERAVNDMTNRLLKSNADALKLASTETARESERGIVDLETLQYTNKQIIDTLTEVVQIQKDGSEKRRAAQAELGKLETEMKQKLLEIQSGN